MDPQIITSAELPAPGEPEPKLTLSQLQSLLRDAAAYERAQRPVALHGPEAYPRPASQTTAEAHPGISVRIPAAPVALVTVGRSERSWWPIVFMASGCTSIGSCLATAVTGDLIPMVVTLAAFAVWAVATYQLVLVREP